MIHALMAGMMAALAFPFVAPFWSNVPILDWAPRELFIFPAIALLYGQLTSAASLRQKIIWVSAAGFSHFALLLYWLIIAMSRFGGLPYAQSGIMLLLLVMACTGFWLLLVGFVPLLHQQLRIPLPIAFAGSVVVTEKLRSVVLFTGFPWGLWGYSQTRFPPFLHLASLGGVYLVSFVVALLGALLWRVWERRKTEQLPQALRHLGLSSAAFMLIGMLCVWNVAPDDQAFWRVAVVQGNIPQEMQLRAIEHAKAIQERYIEMSTQLQFKTSSEGSPVAPDLVIWPEGAWPKPLSPTLQQFPFGPGYAPLLFGGVVYDFKARIARNSAHLADTAGNIVARYDKQHLVPFGEFVPLRKFLPVDKFVPGFVDYTAGTSSAPLGEFRVGVLICYDGVFPEIARAEVESGAKWLVNLTNDGWYGISSAPYQHRDFYVMRAVETSRWVMRAANSGITVLIDPRGGLHDATELATDAVAHYQVPPRNGTTFYVRTGDWVLWVWVALLLMAGLQRIWQTRVLLGSTNPRNV